MKFKTHLDKPIKYKPLKAYAHKYDTKHGAEFTNFYEHPSLTKMCGGEDVYGVYVRVVKPGEKSQYWAWWDNKDKKLSMVWPSKQQVEMCFPYGYKAEEDRGAGKLVNVAVWESRKMK